MSLFRLQPLAAIALSLWLGFLACVLGCTQPVLPFSPSTYIHISDRKTVANETSSGKMADAGPCCHSRGTSEKNKQSVSTISCCPLDATLLQKQDPVSPLRIRSFVVVLMLFVLYPSRPLSASDAIHTPIVWHTGRDVLLQARVLRI